MRLKPLKSSIYLIAAIVLFICAGTWGCNDGSSGSDGDSADTGEVVIGLTDAPGDFVSYTVDVLSVSLTRANGATVETLPLSTGVDFAQYTDMTEFLTSATVPSGVYREVSMTLDYTDAAIYVEKESGETVLVESIVDAEGNPIDTLTVDLTFDENGRLVVAPGITAHMTLDFDLAASNKVEFDETGKPKLTVSPTLIAEIEPESAKMHRLRGPVKSVSLEENAFMVIIRPFFHAMQENGDGNGNANGRMKEDFGAMQVVVGENTVCDINGESYEGDAGLEALAALPEYTGVVVLGDLKFSPRRFEAVEVRAGSSIPGGAMDAVIGNVIGRTVDSLTIKGASLVRSGNSAIFNDEVTVTIGAETVVRGQLAADALTIGDIPVGQRVTALGTFNDALVLDAAAGYVLLEMSMVWGAVVGADETPLVIDLQSVDHMRPDAFDFTGVGIDSHNFEIATGTLDLSGLSAGDPVKVLGFFTADPQPGADLNARTLIAVEAVKGFLKVHWRPASATALKEVSDTQIVLDLTGASMFHHVTRGRVAIDLNDAENSPTITPGADRGLYTIVVGGSAYFYSDFTGFTEALADRIDGGSAVWECSAGGKYNDETAVMEADEMRVHLK